MFGLDFSHVGMLVTILGLTGALGYAYYKVDTKMEELQRAAGKASHVAHEWGLFLLSDILDCFAYKDWDKLAFKIKEAIELLLGGEAKILELFNGVFQKMLAAKLATPEGQEQLGALVSKLGFAVAVEPQRSSTATTK